MLNLDTCRQYWLYGFTCTIYTHSNPIIRWHNAFKHTGFVREHGLTQKHEEGKW